MRRAQRVSMDCLNRALPSRAELLAALEDGPQGTRALRRTLEAEPFATSSIMLVEGLTQCVSHFRPERHAALVDAVLSLHWHQRPKLSPAMPRAVLHFVQELVSAAPAFLRQCIGALVQSFLPTEGEEPEEGASDGEVDEVSPLVHIALDGILRACPIATDFVFDALKAAFPHKRRDARAHVVYVRHCLAVLRYSPALLKRAVGLLVARMVELDVEIALQQRHLEENEEEEEEDEPIFEVRMAIASTAHHLRKPNFQCRGSHGPYVHTTQAGHRPEPFSCSDVGGNQAEELWLASPNALPTGACDAVEYIDMQAEPVRWKEVCIIECTYEMI